MWKIGVYVIKEVLRSMNISFHILRDLLKQKYLYMGAAVWWEDNIKSVITRLRQVRFTGVNFIISYYLNAESIVEEPSNNIITMWFNAD